jgi:hypothetical protein
MVTEVEEELVLLQVVQLLLLVLRQVVEMEWLELLLFDGLLARK